MNKRQLLRNENINKVMIAIQKTETIGRDVDYTKLVMVVMDELMVSERTAKEYLKIASYRVHNAKT